jgi:hypothetical protein
MEQLLGGFGGGGTSISPDNSMHASSDGQFGDHSIGLGGGKYSTLILAGAALLIALIFVWRKS